MNSQTTHHQHGNLYLYAIRECSNYATIIQFLVRPFNFIHACNLLRPYTLERLRVLRFKFKLLSNVPRVIYIFHRTLESVDISQCKNITDADISQFNMCEKLKSLNLSGCKKVTDKGIKSLASSCQQLTNINISRCYKVTDEGMKALASSCQHLTKSKH